MDFFDHQDRARSGTKWLVFLFGLAWSTTNRWTGFDISILTSAARAIETLDGVFVISPTYAFVYPR